MVKKLYIGGELSPKLINVKQIIGLELSKILPIYIS